MTLLKRRNRNLLNNLCLTIGLVFIYCSTANGQPAGTTNFYNQIKTYNLSSLWHGEQLKLISLKETKPFPEPFGVVGSNYQRFYIHYSSIVKDALKPYQYNVAGKTRIGKQIRSFKGTITVTQAGIFKPGPNNPYAPDSYKGFKRGKLLCRIVLQDAGSTPTEKIISGELTTDFCINAQNQLLYDTLDFGIDGYGNNQFTGTWKSTGTKTVQKLQFGDFTILDSPFSEVDGITVPPEYEKYGWQSFVQAIPNDFGPASKAAIAEEKRQWWK